MKTNVDLFRIIAVEGLTVNQDQCLELLKQRLTDLEEQTLRLSAEIIEVQNETATARKRLIELYDNLNETISKIVNTCLQPRID